ncbi:hypothetical protein APE_0266b [Aeropyrum pernix K1]|uniref:Uncharacterized protein n=1 Tax=Aeropyrum pernix (strain ATCC 700893 / DSM 11879 / JCM 9820 / NBRC 100138 / K1) TaxID=272557 RepID=Q9YFH5_AERPE|nr:hypothetical protein [Aeropyrum pernix]BAA79186.1 hypothetical protein APE_0266b [Aeropyrum pernix K1]
MARIDLESFLREKSDILKSSSAHLLGEAKSNVIQAYKRAVEELEKIKREGVEQAVETLSK